MVGLGRHRLLLRRLGSQTMKICGAVPEWLRAQRCPGVTASKAKIRAHFERSEVIPPEIASSLRSSQ
jgi:hypothetical protein